MCLAYRVQRFGLYQELQRRSTLCLVHGETSLKKYPPSPHDPVEKVSAALCVVSFRKTLPSGSGAGHAAPVLHSHLDGHLDRLHEKPLDGIYIQRLTQRDRNTRAFGESREKKRNGPLPRAHRQDTKIQRTAWHASRACPQVSSFERAKSVAERTSSNRERNSSSHIFVSFETAE